MFTLQQKMENFGHKLNKSPHVQHPTKNGKLQLQFEHVTPKSNC
jgi:hypothetical protein